MAKNIGIIKFTGKLGGLSGRDTAFGNVIQTPGGFKSEAVKNEARYLPTRQLAAEFGRCSKIASLFRQLLLPYLKLLPDPYVYNHIQKRMAAIKACDVDSPKGEKTVGKGLLTADGAALLRDFSFDRKRQFYFTGMQSHSFDAELGVLALEGLDVAQFNFPAGADTLAFQLLLLRVDFDAPSAALQCSEFVYVLKTEGVISVRLQAVVPDGEGMVVGVLFSGYCGVGDLVVWRKKGVVLQVVGIEV